MILGMHCNKYRRQSELMSQYNVSLKTYLLEPEFYGDLVYTFSKIVGKTDFSEQSKEKVTRCNMDILRQTACMVVNPIKVDKILFSFVIARRFRPQVVSEMPVALLTVPRRFL